MLKRFIKACFTFNRSERNGIILLLSLLLLLTATRAAIPFLVREQVTDFSRFEEELALFEESLQAGEGGSREAGSPAQGLFAFDPNKAGRNEMEVLGLDRFVIDNIIKYREKGGQFHRAGDLKKIYGLKEEAFHELEPFIRIEPLQEVDGDTMKRIPGDPGPVKELSRPEGEGAAGGRVTRKREEHPGFTGPAIPLNLADSVNLARLPGIGPVLSSRIIRYRELLGGYYSREQLLEVYGMTPERYERIRGLVSIDTGNIRLIDLNSPVAGQFPYHPYITGYQFRAIIRYRELNGRFKRIEEVRENRLLPPGVFEKAKHYLAAE